MKLEGRVVVITGAASGIGRASAREFAREGAQVVVADIGLAGAEETVKQIETAGGVAIAVETDVAVAESVQSLVEQTDIGTIRGKRSRAILALCLTAVCVDPS